MGRRTPVHVEVKVTDQQNIEKAIKKFTRKVKKSGVLEEVRERRYFTKRSVKRRMKKLEKKRLIKIANEKEKRRLEKEYR
jgi:small subunit ribosomal protein S21|tara:strand:- start:1352 stop:1591 length:240 start_codon:yes stop_codon:yes gene_type:complete